MWAIVTRTVSIAGALPNHDWTVRRGWAFNPNNFSEM